jgi:hypothetical protein
MFGMETSHDWILMQASGDHTNPQRRAKRCLLDNPLSKLFQACLQVCYSWLMTVSVREQFLGESEHPVPDDTPTHPARYVFISMTYSLRWIWHGRCE